MFERHFTPEDADALLPKVELLIESLRAAKRSLDAYDSEFAILSKRINARGGLLVDLGDWSAKRVLRESAATTVEERFGALQELGVVLRDLEMGLVDFPSLMDDEEVFLCWKAGENQIQFWHGPSEGHTNRKPLIGGPQPHSTKNDPVQ
jgi:hypothetical protein